MNNIPEQRKVLRVEGLKKNYGKKTAVEDVSFSMNSGEVVGLLGPNGAGKTTIFYMIVGFIHPNQGDIFLDDKNITKLPMYQRARMGISYLSQEPSIFSKLSVENNIWGILETRNDLTKPQKKEFLEELLESFGIQGLRKQPAYRLSGGERRRTEIARNLAVDPKFLLLDEPFAGIDPKTVQEIKSIIRVLSHRGIGVLITDHNARDTLDITDCTYIIKQGEIVESGSKEKIAASQIARESYFGEDFSL